MTTFKPDIKENFPGWRAYADRILSGVIRPKFGPLDRNPCAHTVVAKASVCPNPGTMACSACKMVSYCSKGCQKAHWKEHKKDCNDPIRSDSWRPVWERDYRPPSFVHSTENDLDIPDSPLSLGMALWGNTPAIDLINLKANEKDVEKDFNLAFVASGDLRHVMKTINDLPAEYNGRLRILINDHNPVVAARNIALLLILGQIPDQKIAADVALHFWYSIFMPMEYKMMLSVAVGNWITNTDINQDFELGPRSKMSARYISDLKVFFMHMVRPVEEGEVEGTLAEYWYIREHPSRKDLRDRVYSRLRPSHRLAFQEYRRSGVVLPFGAISAHFNVQNRSLFSFSGDWEQTDFADPLEGWSMNEIVEAGRAHGAHAEDIYGCFYFFISDHLRTLWRRLRTFKISFVMTRTESGTLANAIKGGELLALGMSRSSGFDRIHVSNILDTTYVGLESVLDAWAPLISVSQTAAIVGYFMNWVGSQEGGRAVDLPDTEVQRLFKRMEDEGKAKLPIIKPASGMTMRLFGDFQNAMYFMASNVDFLYENSDPFSKFLRKQGSGPLLKKHGLKLRKKYTIVPHRIGVPIGSGSSDLPQFDDKDSWYHQSSMLSHTGFERFVEFACI